MVQLIEGTHYRRRGNQPSPAPHKSKKIDPGDDDDAHGDQTRRKRSRPTFWKCSQEKIEADRAKHSIGNRDKDAVTAIAKATGRSNGKPLSISLNNPD